MEWSEQEPKVRERFVAGDLDAFEILFRQFQGEVYGWIIHLVRDSGAAEDLTVETFWRIHRARARFDPSRSFGAWARRIATNVALDHLKSAQVQADRRSDTSDEHDLPETLAVGAIPDPSIQQELRECTQRAFHQLPVKLQVVATLALIEERSHAEIAEALNISAGAVKSRLFRAVGLLRKKLKQFEV